MITSIRGSIHQGHEAFSEHSRGRQCSFMSLAALLFNRLNSVDLKGFEYSLTLLDEINSLLHVALLSVTVTNCSNDQFMDPLLPLYV